MSPSSPRFARGICLFRLSAIGDVAHTVAVVRTLQVAFPAAPLTWVVGRVEAAVAALVPGVELIVVDKRHPWAEMRRLRRELRGRRFDVLLHLQVSFRANLISLGIPARERWGFDYARSKEGHSWVIDHRVPPAPPPGEHVLDGLLRFPLALGASEPIRRWDLNLPADAVAWAEQVAPRDERPLIAVNVCASRPVKDWRAPRYAEVIRHAITRHHARVVLCGGRSEREQAMAQSILAALPEHERRQVLSLVGQTTLPQLLALLARARALVSPDSGPVHLASAVGTAVVGLYGATNLLRCGPSLEQRWCIAKREEAGALLLGKPANQLEWSQVVPGGMDLIESPEVCAKLDALLAATPPA